VLTAGHCILKNFDYNYGNTSYNIPVVPNEFYPTYGSIYQVFLGAHGNIFYDTDVKPAVALGVDEVILVTNLSKL
jgi:hypothetical protein